MQSSRAALIVALGSLLVAGCAAADMPEQSGDSGESSQALSSTCKLSRAQILGSVSGGRLDAIKRGFSWFDAKVPYSQSRSYQGYRTDCSGFVSMCWQLGTSQTTATFAAGASSSALPSYDSLQPADALVHRSGGSGHIVLFLGWNDAAHSSACVIEEASTASDMQFRSFSTSYLKGGGYKPIRADDLASAPSAPSSPSAPSAPSAPDQPPASTPAGDDTAPPAPTPAPSPPDTTGGGGCYSPTMGKTMPEGACVQSAADEVTEQCHEGLWYRGVSGGDGPYGPCQ